MMMRKAKIRFLIYMSFIFDNFMQDHIHVRHETSDSLKEPYLLLCVIFPMFSKRNKIKMKITFQTGTTTEHS